ncbi:MAG: hypothetical protein AUH33_06245 [Chloroflexi bacterium 13_1_40CM_68_21]|nr:MAG: hypothetical protein AUH33_06245 [Chloroflexi bacterium 13_1_40CM_68_21]
MVLPLVEDVLRSLVLREAAVFASSAVQSSGLPMWQQVGMGFEPRRACAPSVDAWPHMGSDQRKRLRRRCSEEIVVGDEGSAGDATGAS